MILARGWEEWADKSNTDVSGGDGCERWSERRRNRWRREENFVCKNAPPALEEVPVSQPQAVSRGLVVIIAVITGYRHTANQWQSHSNQVCVSFTMWTDFYTVSLSKRDMIKSTNHNCNLHISASTSLWRTILICSVIGRNMSCSTYSALSLSSCLAISLSLSARSCFIGLSAEGIC